MRTAQSAIDEDLKIAVGVGATWSVGSDSYPYYISEVLPNGVIGLYNPGSHFENDWTDGHKIVDVFDPSHASEFYLKRCYGTWWKVSRDGKIRLERFTSKCVRFTIGHAYAYSDPSF